MRGHTHLLFAILFGILYFDYFAGEIGLWLKLGFAALLIVGALLPDIDQSESSASHKAPVLSGIVRAFSKHRGLMHSIWIPLIIFLVAKFVVSRFFYVPDIIMMGFVVGYFSHLLGDIFTIKGITPFSPFSKFRLKGWFKTGGIAESVIGILIVAFIIIH